MPAKFAVAVKLPEIVGLYVKVYMPLASVVAVPMLYVLPLESVTLIVTGTPVKLVGCACCWYM